MEDKKKQQRHRAHLSCSECRRCKLKCDRQFPCSSCRNRGAAHICPTGTLQPLGRVTKAQLEVTALAKRLQELEGVIKEAGISHKLPPLELGTATSRRPTPPLEEDEETDDYEGGVPMPMPNIVRGASLPDSASSGPGSSMDQVDGYEDDLEGLMDGVGSLSIREADGRTRYLGASAGSAYFATGRDEEEEDDSDEQDYYVPSPANGISNYPFIQLGTAYPKAPELERLRGYLPDLEEGERLAICYWKYLSFMFEPLEEKVFWEEYFPEAYREGSSEGTKLACVFIILALGTLFDPDVPSTPNALSMSYFQLSQAALSASRFLSNNTIAAAQTLQLSANILFNTHNLQEGGETFFPILGMALRLVVTMGLHRDGSKWGLTGPELNRRRLVFYELMTLDRMQAFISGRPYMINPAHFDTEMPTNAPDYQIWKWKLGIFLGKVIDESFSVKAPTYPIVLSLDQELRDIFAASPSHLRCGALPDTAFTVKPTGTPVLPPQRTYKSEKDLKQRMRTHTLEMVFAQIFCPYTFHKEVGWKADHDDDTVYLHKPAFAQALQLYPDEPLASPWAASVAAVSLETGVYMLAIAKSWVGLHPVLCPRWWHIFFHAFAASVAQSSLVIKSPGSMLARHAWTQLNLAVDTFELASAGGAPVAMLTPRLKTLRDTAFASLQASLNVSRSMGMPGVPESVEELAKDTDANLSVLGPATRLERHPKREKVAGSPASSQEGSLAMAVTQGPAGEALYTPFDSPFMANSTVYPPATNNTPYEPVASYSFAAASQGPFPSATFPTRSPLHSTGFDPSGFQQHLHTSGYMVPNPTPSTSPPSVSPSSGPHPHLMSMATQANQLHSNPSSSNPPSMSAFHLLNQHAAMLQAAERQQLHPIPTSAPTVSPTRSNNRAVPPKSIETPDVPLNYSNYSLTVGGATWGDSPIASYMDQSTDSAASPPLMMYNTPGVQGDNDIFSWYDFTAAGAQ